VAGLAAAAPADAPEAGKVQGLRPLERLAAALPAGGRALATPARGAGSRPIRSVGAVVAGRRLVRPAQAFPVVGVPPDYGAADARFGADRGGHVHEGQDLFAPAGTPLVAVSDGEVVEKGDDGGRGNYVALFSPAARRTYLYLHMREPSRLEPGERVRAGGRLGRVGCTGSCWGDHLHFEARLGRGTRGRAVDPLPLLRRLERG
jgi:murein DD-endopeptidase MepM/ murein hydrolase activator NlpD